MRIKRFSATKILNTNSAGFIRGRKYDTDLDRLGRSSTQRELSGLRKLNFNKEIREVSRKTKKELADAENININRELKDMATYRLKRKTFGVIGEVGNVAKNVVGGTMETVGNVASSGVGKMAGAVGGAALAGKAMAAKIGGAATLGLGLTPIGVLGAIGAGIAGAAVAKGVGKGIKKMGQNLQDSAN